MDMALSLRTTSRFVASPRWGTPALLSASNARPADMAPSPMMATQRLLWPCKRAACAIPSAAEMEVDECAVPKLS